MLMHNFFNQSMHAQSALQITRIELNIKQDNIHLH